MTTKDKLNKKLEELKAKLIGQSKDAHFAKALIDDLLSVKGQLSVEPLELNVGKKIDSFESETFEIVKTDRGALYHEFGGYSIFVNDNNTALYDTLVDFVDNKETYASLTDEHKEQYDLNQSAVAYCLSVPKFCFADAEFTYEIATKAVEFLRKTYEKSIEQPLQEETVADDKQFKEARLAVDKTREMITEAIEEYKSEE